jgi:very-short-patch-repair endonuclease
VGHATGCDHALGPQEEGHQDPPLAAGPARHHPPLRDPGHHPGTQLLDLAEVLDTPSLTRAVNEARLRRKATLTDLAELLNRSPGRATKRLRPFIQNPSGPTRSEFEDAFLAFVNRHGLPTPETNQIVAGYEVDVLWREHELIVELDGREFHENAFEEDRERDATLLSAGLSVLRITWQRLTQQEQSEADRLQSILDQRSTIPGPPA